MDKYLNSYREMISLRGLTDHTIKGYSTYIKAYFEFLTDVIHKSPEDVSWDEMRQFIQWVQSTRSLSDRTINAIISQLRFFTMYVLHKPWDNTQLPMRRFNTYLPYVPTIEEVQLFINTLPTLKQKNMVALMYSAGLRVGEVCNLRYSDIKRSSMRIHVAQAKNVAFFDAASVAKPSKIDGIHMEPESHRALGLALAEEVRRLTQD